MICLREPATSYEANGGVARLFEPIFDGRKARDLPPRPSYPRLTEEAHVERTGLRSPAAPAADAEIASAVPAADANDHHGRQTAHLMSRGVPRLASGATERGGVRGF
jgi:hypothetical protein